MFKSIFQETASMHSTAKLLTSFVVSFEIILKAAHINLAVSLQCVFELNLLEVSAIQSYSCKT